MIRYFLMSVILLFYFSSFSQNVSWANIDTDYLPLPDNFHVYKSVSLIEDSANIMYYVRADLKNKEILFSTDTSKGRRLTPQQFFEKNNQPLLVVNGSFFTFDTHRNLNVVVKDGRVVSYNEHSLPQKGKDTLTFIHPFFGVFGINIKRKADIAWVYSDSSSNRLYATQNVAPAFKDSVAHIDLQFIRRNVNKKGNEIYGAFGEKAPKFKRWKMQSAIGGGPVLVQNGVIAITNNEERKFAGKAVDNREPRTAIGYTSKGELIVFVCEGRSKNAAGLTLPQMAKIMLDLGCIEALNLDGGGSTCLLVNGKQTNTPSSKGEQRPVPSVFMIQSMK